MTFLTCLKKRIKTCSFSCFCCLLCLSAVITLSFPAIDFANKVIDKYVIEVVATGESNVSSKGTEVWINQITVDNVPLDLTEIELSSDWHYSKDMTSIYGIAADGKASSPLIIGPFPAESVVDFSLGTHSWSGFASFLYPEGEHIADLYSEYESTTSRYFELPEACVDFNGMSAADWILLLMKHTAVFFSSFLFLFFISNSKELFFTFTYVIVCVVLWCCSSYIFPAKSMMLFIGFLSCFSFYIVVRNWNNPLLIPYHCQIKYFVRVLLICLYSAFASFGYKLFSSDACLVISRGRLRDFLLGFLWFFPIVMGVITILEKKALSVNNSIVPEKPTPKRRVFLISFIISFAVLSVSFFGFFPGGFPSDVVDQLIQAKTGVYNNSHPVVHTLILKLCMSVVHHPSMIILVQMVVLSLLIGKVAVIAYECNVKPTRVFLSVAVFVALPNQAVTAITAVKDSMFTYCLLWCTILLYELALDINSLHKASFLIKMSVCLFLVKELRHNGIAPFIFVTILFIWIAFRYKRTVCIQAITCIVASVTMVIVMEGPVFSYLSVSPNTVSPTMPMMCAVGSCLNKDKILSNESMLRLQEVMSIKSWKEYYRRFQGHDGYIWDGGDGMDLRSLSINESLSIYNEALFKYPEIVIKDRLDGSDIMWDISQPDDEDSFNIRTNDAVWVNSSASLSFLGMTDGDYYYNHSKVADFYRSLVTFSFPGELPEDQVSDILLWRTGSYLILYLVLMLFWRKNNLRKMFWPSMPLLGNVFILAIGLYYQSFRYVYFIQVLTITLLIMTFNLKKVSIENTGVDTAE